MKTTNMAMREMWHMSVMKWYSTTSKRNHINVAPAKIAADKCLFLHSKTSATKEINPCTRNYKLTCMLRLLKPIKNI